MESRLVFQRLGTRAHSAFVQWLQFVAFVVEPAGSLEGQALRREVRRALEEIVAGLPSRACCWISWIAR